MLGLCGLAAAVTVDNGLDAAHHGDVVSASGSILRNILDEAHRAGFGTKDDAERVAVHRHRHEWFALAFIDVDERSTTLVLLPCRCVRRVVAVGETQGDVQSNLGSKLTKAGRR